VVEGRTALIREGTQRGMPDDCRKGKVRAKALDDCKKGMIGGCGVFTLSLGEGRGESGKGTLEVGGGSLWS